MDYIVECSVCHQPWAVAEHMMAPGIAVPPHEMLSSEDNRGLGPCQGVSQSGIGHGRVETWATGWQGRHAHQPGRSRPTVADGAVVEWQH